MDYVAVRCADPSCGVEFRAAVLNGLNASRSDGSRWGFPEGSRLCEGCRRRRYYRANYDGQKRKRVLELIRREQAESGTTEVYDLDCLENLSARRRRQRERDLIAKRVELVRKAKIQNMIACGVDCLTPGQLEDLFYGTFVPGGYGDVGKRYDAMGRTG